MVRTKKTWLRTKSGKKIEAQKSSKTLVQGIALVALQASDDLAAIQISHKLKTSFGPQKSVTDEASVAKMSALNMLL